MQRVLPNAVRIAAAHPAETIFTRFIPAQHPGEGRGVWRRYWRRWASMTRERLAPDMIDLVPDLARFTPPARIIDKKFYSPWLETNLEQALRRRKVGTLVISGGETDVCVLAAVLGGVDRGDRVVIVADALCSSSDDTHDALMTLYAQRYTQQVETARTDEVIENWQAA
jgi:nicotinamidase-related amidase